MNLTNGLFSTFDTTPSTQKDVPQVSLSRGFSASTASNSIEAQKEIEGNPISEEIADILKEVSSTQVSELTRNLDVKSFNIKGFRPHPLPEEDTIALQVFLSGSTDDYDLVMK